MKKWILVFSVCVFALIIFPIKNENKVNNSKFNIYLESSDGYIKSDTDKFPNTGYKLNTSKSTCENGSILSQDILTKAINISISKSDKCNLYFNSESNNTLNKLHSLNSNIEVKSAIPDFSKISSLPTEYRDNGIGTTEESYTIPVNTSCITYGDNYTFNSTTGRYSLTNPQTCKWDECYQNLTDKYYCYNALYTNNVMRNYSNMKELYKITNNSNSTTIYFKSTTYDAISYNNDENGIFKMEDNYGTSLYFRGNIENNYVKFGKDKNNQDMYWRIIRINGDGTLRLIYDGTTAHENTEISADRVVGRSSWNSNDAGSPHDSGYAGYMYGNFDTPTGCSCTSHTSEGNCIYTCTGGGSTSYEQAHANIKNSTVKAYLDNWYEENIINTGYSDNVADEIFCNDRTKRANDLGYGLNDALWGANIRLVNASPAPAIKCSQKNDSFTVSDNINGNGKLTYPVGLITADEVQMGGLVTWVQGEFNKNSYLFKGFWYWTMSPSTFYYTSASTSGEYVFAVRDTGYIVHNWVKNQNYVAPVINLKTDYISNFTGNGTKNNPFTVNE